MKLHFAGALVGLIVVVHYSLGLEERIYNGQVAQQGQFPHQASLIMTLQDGNSSLCGGSLISKDFVLTAGHCPYKAKSLTVTLGHLKYNDFSSNGVQTFTVPASNVYFNGYDPNTLANDISLIKLPKPATISNVVQTIRLPPKAWADPDVISNYVVEESGWGKANDSDSLPQTDLHFAYGITMTNKDCLDIWTGYKDLGKSIICTNRRLIDSGVCFGDSGGPLGVNYRRRRYVAGVASFVKTCYSQEYPNVFTNVAYHLDWISKTTGITVQ